MKRKYNIGVKCVRLHVIIYKNGILNGAYRNKHDDGLRLGQRRRRWPSPKPTLGQRTSEYWDADVYIQKMHVYVHTMVGWTWPIVIEYDHCSHYMWQNMYLQ